VAERAGAVGKATATVGVTEGEASRAARMREMREKRERTTKQSKLAGASTVGNQVT
jgi:hypothetical protein